jgi:glycerate dehydrogenase
MKIVVLDGYTMNPGDLDWGELRRLGEVTIHARTTPAETVARALGADAVLTNKVVLGRTELAALPGLRYIGVLATGYNVVDLPAAHERGVVVTNVPAYSTESVVQSVFAHLLNLAQGLAAHTESVQRGDWVRSQDFMYTLTPLVELSGKTLGIVGYGRIGRRVAAVARALGMRVLVHTRTPPDDDTGIACVELDRLFAESDVVTLHCPLTPQTERLVNAGRLRTMKPSAFLISTSRGPLLDEQAVADALNAGRLAGAGLDVLSTEPPKADNPLLAARNCHITPHTAWATREARGRLYHVAVQNLRAFLAGAPINALT